MKPQPAAWLADGEYIHVDGLRIFTKTIGRGHPLLCLHAFPTSSYDYSQLAPLLADSYQLIFLDYPGFGFSEKPRHYPYSLFKYTDAVEAVCKHYGHTSLWLCAHDIGDSIALELLRRNTLHIENLTLLNGSILSIPFTDPLMALSQKLWLNPFWGGMISRLRLFRKPLFALMFNRIFGRALSPAEIEAFWSLLTHNNGLAIYHRLMGYMPERWQHQHQWLDVLAQHPVPLTLIWGQADPVATPAVAEHILTLRPANYIPLNGVGHYPHWDAPAKVADVLLDLLLPRQIVAKHN